MKKFIAILLLAIIVCNAVEDNPNLKGWIDVFSDEAKEFINWILQNPTNKKYIHDAFQVSEEYGIEACKKVYNKPDKCEAIVKNIFEVFRKYNGNK